MQYISLELTDLQKYILEQQASLEEEIRRAIFIPENNEL